MSELQLGKVNNGQRVQVETGDYVGIAGLSANGGTETVAYVPDRSGSRPRIGGTITVAGKARTVTSISKSDYVQHMVLIRLEKESE